MFTYELRIGNWVQRIGYPLKVTGIKGSDVWVDGNGVELEYYIYDGINPITLTEEWLIKFGFKRIKDDKSFQIENTYFDLQVYLPGNYFGVVAGRDEIALNYNLKYVHQLQNLYFALTGEEL